MPNQTFRSWVATVKFSWVILISLLFLSVMWQPSTFTGSCNIPSPAATPLIALLRLLLETDTCFTWETVSVAFYFWIALLHCLWCCLLSIIQMRSSKWNYVTASVFKFLTNVCSLFWALQLTEETAGVVEVSLLEIHRESRLTLGGLLYFCLDTLALVPSPSPSIPIQFLNSKRNLQELG